MKTRVTTAIIALIIFLPLLYVGGEYFKYTTFALGVMAMYEIVKMTFKQTNIVILGASSLAGALLYLKDEILSLSQYATVYLLVIAMLSVVVKTGHKVKLVEIGSIIFVTAYIFIGFYCLYMLRDLSLVHVGYLLLTIWFTDSFAYFGGMKFGKNKLSPKISPNKSIEGSVIGSLSSIIIALAFYFTTNIFTNVLVAILVTLVVSVVGQFGDLIESAYKREYGVKDSSNLLPGHGGIFDRFDSVILSAPCLILLLNFVA
ncbi:phosphatidate cytidylyltransferase [Gemella cuniculi]|uniref:phosphatidate cytidylyltransferase n=1 Tax=Gemella cuniculi TaxID=150240 RepID=UPI0003FD44B2|nr:phosphatidate cytidylyltransferase [Gemella cuniculi]